MVAPRFSRLAVALAALLAACRDTPLGTTSLSAVPGQRPATLADQLRDLGRRAPGFTGIYFDSVGRLTIAYAGPTFDALNVAEVLAWAAGYSGAVSPTARARLVRRAFSYVALDSVYHQILGPGIGRITSVTSSGVNEAQGVIELTVEHPTDVGAVRGLAARLGVPAAMVRVSVLARAETPVATAQCLEECGGGGGGGSSYQTLSDVVRPIDGGLEISWDSFSVCTLGLNGYRVRDGMADPSLGTYFMTAAHCAPQRGVTTGTLWGQPRVDIAPIGVEVWTAPILSGSQCPNTYPRCTYADVMVVKYDDPSTAGYGVVESTPFMSTTIIGRLGVTGEIYGALIGETVYKVGRTTGTTAGRIALSCVDINTRQEPDLYTLCTQRAAYQAGGGDSGAPVFIPFDPTRSAVTPRTVGIHFASLLSASPPQSYFSTITQIWRAQDYQFWW